MALSDYVTLSITQATANLTRAGFGVAMHLSYTPTWSERSRTYTTYNGVIADFPITTGPEARAALTYFSQNPQPTAFIIGRGANKPTKTVTLSALNPTTNLNYPYKVNVKGTGFADAIATFTSDGTPTAAEYSAGMTTQLNAVAGKNYTATDGGNGTVTITGATAGAWFSLEVTDVAYQTTTETTADPGVAADIAAILAENPSWYALHTAFNSKLYSVACAAVIEATGSKIYVAASNDTSTVLNASTGTADLADQVKTNAYNRTSVHYHRDPSAFFDLGLMARCLTFDPGTETWAFKTVAGTATFPMTATHRANIVARNANSYENVAGLNISFNGTMGSGRFIDFQRASDALQDDMSKAVFGALANNPKLPYTDQGIAVIKSVMTGSLLRFSTPGGFLQPGFVVSVPKAVNVSSADKAARVLNNCTFTATSQGAVHKDNVTGAIA